MKILIQAVIDIDPETRGEMLAGARGWIEGALKQPGCLAYAWTPTRMRQRAWPPCGSPGLDAPIARGTTAPERKRASSSMTEPGASAKCSTAGIRRSRTEGPSIVVPHVSMPAHSQPGSGYERISPCPARHVR